MPRNRTAVVASLLFVPIIAGGFLLQDPPARANARLFDQVVSLISRQYVDTIESSELLARAARGLVRELHDPYTELFSRKESEEFARGTNGRYGGTGMLLGEEDERAVTVQRVFPNTPAEEAGVREGDRILSIGDSSVADWGLNRVSEHLRGIPGSKVNVAFGRSGVVGPIRLTFTRREVHVPAVPYSTVINGAGYIPLQTFNENAAEEVEAAVKKLVAQGAKGLVLDLRDNGGGIVEQALEISTLFLKDGQDIVTVRARGTTDEVARTHGTHVATGVPLVVLTDGGTASAAEIVAGALQDHDRALVLGSTTYGKGLVQSLFSLDEGYSLKLTTGKWYTPSGRSIHRERRVTEDGRVLEGRLEDGKIIEGGPDSTETEESRLKRPQFRSDAGRIVYGGGGIVPDFLVREDTVSTLQQEFVRSIAPKSQQLQTVLQQYSLELKDQVSQGYSTTPAWRAELRRRLKNAGVTIDARFDSVATAMLGDELDRRVARRAFGDGEAKRRSLSTDRPLVRAIELLQQSRSQQDLLRIAAAKATSKPAD
ncbi:MAG TPA: S41 family peptidase [Gemmatimonadaceae bacterium]|nr:S41 family peptidase [Gemmatimonadaceae bacterium]